MKITVKNKIFILEIGNYNPTSIETNTFSGTQNLTNYKYGGGNQEKYTNKGTSLISKF